MTTLDFLKDNRSLIINFYNGNVKNESKITLKDFMIKLMNDFNHTVKVVDIYTEKNLYANLFDVQYSVVENNEIGVSFEKPYSESNHAKSVNYYGKNKTEQFNNL